MAHCMSGYCFTTNHFSSSCNQLSSLLFLLFCAPLGPSTFSSSSFLLCSILPFAVLAGVLLSCLLRNLCVYVIRMPSRWMCEASFSSSPMAIILSSSSSSVSSSSSLFFPLSLSLSLVPSAAQKCLPFSLAPLVRSHVDRFIHHMKYNAFTLHLLCLSLSSFFSASLFLFLLTRHTNSHFSKYCVCEDECEWRRKRTRWQKLHSSLLSLLCSALFCSVLLCVHRLRRDKKNSDSEEERQQDRDNKERKKDDQENASSFSL